MGQEIDRTRYAQEDFHRFRQRLAEETQSLLAFGRRGGFADTRLVAGLELEAWLLDHAGYPSPINEPYLARLANPLVVAELSRFNVELNSPPCLFGSGVLASQEQDLASVWGDAQRVAHDMDAALAMIGIPPTLRAEDLSVANMSALNRFVVLNDQVLRQRGGRPIQIRISGQDSLHLDQGDVMLEAATTSFQLHLQVPEAMSGRYYNAALITCAPLLAAATNSPLLFGHRLWQETRIPLFEQAVELGGYGGLQEAAIRRVSFGRAYLEGSLLAMFQENLDHYPVLLPMQLGAEHGPFAHVRLHNGSIWRWVRPLIGFDAGLAHVRIEQRVLPSGPTMLDMIANMAFSHGLTHALANLDAAPETRLPFEAARANFYAAAKAGLGAELRWLGGEVLPARDLVLEVCLPLAEQGLHGLGLGAGEVERYLGILRARVISGQTGAVWLLRRLDRLGGDLERLMADYLEYQRTGVPVHEWDA